MQTQDRPAPIFVGDSVALDFLNSVATPRTTKFEWLETGNDLLDWLVQSGLCSNEEVKHLKSTSHRPDLEQAVQDILEFREEFRDFISAASERPEVLQTHPMIVRINDLLRKGTQHLQIDETLLSTTGFSLTNKHVLQSAQDLLPRIAAACAKLICEADFRYVRNCEGPTCTLFFLDISKNHKRRWCAMEVCGNRAKAAAHRKK